MPVRSRGAVKEWQLRTPAGRLLLWGGWLLGTAAFVYCWQLLSGRTIWMFVLDAPEQAADLAVRMVPPRWPAATMSFCDSITTISGSGVFSFISVELASTGRINIP